MAAAGTLRRVLDRDTVAVLIEYGPALDVHDVAQSLRGRRVDLVTCPFGLLDRPSLLLALQLNLPSPERAIGRRILLFDRGLSSLATHRCFVCEFGASLNVDLLLILLHALLRYPRLLGGIRRALGQALLGRPLLEAVVLAELRAL